MDVPRQQFFTTTGFATDQHGDRTWGQLLQLGAQLTRARIDEHQRLGADAQRTFFCVGKGQQRLTEGFKTHGRLPPKTAGRRGAMLKKEKVQARRRA